MENTTIQLPRRVHFFYNSKGGVGKSHNALNLCQWHRDSGRPFKAFDADATSATFSSLDSFVFASFFPKTGKTTFRNDA